MIMQSHIHLSHTCLHSYEQDYKECDSFTHICIIIIYDINMYIKNNNYISVIALIWFYSVA